MLQVKYYVDNWIAGLLAHDELSCLEAVSSLIKTADIPKEVVPSKRMLSDPNRLENSMLLRTCFDESYLAPQLTVDVLKPVLILGPLSTGALMSAITASTMSTMGYEVKWFPV